ncbi:L,D-transpeptidase [Amycolatopsis tucumanensis]|nr:L,D-transpeptidase [Amycolatopsis tucumanensis]
MTAPVSPGKPTAKCVSGTLLVMTVQSPYTMDSSTYGVPADSPGGYRTTVQYALRLTNSGQFLHSAPLSVADQGRTNVSHGCINMSTANAKWFYENSHRGDVVEVSDTGEQIKPGDGWTDWRFTWEQWLQGR